MGYPDPVPLTDPAVVEDIARKALAVPTCRACPSPMARGVMQSAGQPVPTTV